MLNHDKSHPPVLVCTLAPINSFYIIVAEKKEQHVLFFFGRQILVIFFLNCELILLIPVN